ncbi:FGGY-family carbohydrate kinase [Roseibium sp.]|uniref:FGGY-family carbohydrate kinase n=1 Tax=Roseibium sp. TaxID=1936156 RepID=UPI003A98593F
MPDIRHVGVIDIGKTNAKVAAVELETGCEIGVRKQSNVVLNTGPYPHYDINGLWAFILDGLRDMHAAHHIDAISVTTHGASIVLLDDDGNLAVPVLDYEFTGPDALGPAYDSIRPAFAETGSPRLGMGLNVGAQLHWQFQTDPGLLARTACVLTYPQYWAYRLTGVQANEVTSLGCHTDLWCPECGTFSALVDRLGLKTKMAPVQPATQVLGTVTPELGATLGVPDDLPVVCGIHDSNASLYPHLLRRKPPFSVVSSGTWVIVLALGGASVDLDPARDTLMNVNALGDQVPSARFMGGREFDMVMSGRVSGATRKEIDEVLHRHVMLFPAVETRSGPFRGRQSCWTVEEATLSDGQRFATVSFYLALMTAECLKMAGGRGETIVEGPFSQNQLYLDMLASATGRPVVSSYGSSTGTSAGAAMLLAPALPDLGADAEQDLRAPEVDPSFQPYAATWQATVADFALL